MSKFNLLLLGNTSVKKADFFNQFADKKMNPKLERTFMDHARVNFSVDGLDFSVKVWNSVRTEKIQNLTANFYS